ncbi:MULTISPECIES: hypothetical protein [unclassified Clostridium]|nr:MULTISPECIES: hypothetical protein [unclassified Clostridium]
MKKLFNKTLIKKIIEFLLYGPGYKAPEYAYVRANKTSNKNISTDTIQR